MERAFNAVELARRQVLSRRLGWTLGAFALVLYLIGFLIQ